jgi:DNA mismatch repair protein MSH6
LDRLGKNSFIPNDTTLNTENGSCMLLTGPNMGGKSTLLRQTCLATIVAQIGCRVQANSYRGTIVDAIFTRVGASDRILEGQSTFFVELSETATILKSASRHSLVILDELGRGTSTFDGTAIAHAVVEKLVDIGCLTMFATHYHSLVKEVGRLPGVSLGHMACVAEQSGEKQDVTFLYKLESGASDRSYGLNVARLARLPEEIIKRAHEMSQKFECAFEYHLRNRLLEDIKEYSAKGDVKRLRTSIERIDIFLQ